MINLKKLFFVLTLGIVLTFSSYSVFASCKIIPDSIAISSGSKNLGSFDDSDQVYIRADLDANPLTLEYSILNDENSCYDSDSFKFKLFSTGSQINANSVITSASGSNYLTKVLFTFDVEIVVTSPFLSTYSVSNLIGGSGSGSLQFLPDNSAPAFDSFVTSADSIIKSGDEFSVDYTVSDSGSGLDYLSITGGISQIISFDSDGSYTGEFVDTPSSSRTYTFTAEDKLGFRNVKSVDLTVDGNGPSYLNLRKVYEYDGTRRVSLSVDVKDESFEIVDSFVPVVTADLTPINPSVGVMTGSCTKISLDTFTCNFNDVQITLGDTTTVPIKFSSNDVVLNTGLQTFNEEIFVDKTGPVISEFYLENSLGVRNILSSTDTNARVVLKFTDESVSEGGVVVAEEFGSLPFPIKDCTFVGDSGECIWELSGGVSAFANSDDKSFTLRVGVSDLYGNYNVKELNFVVDNTEPTIDSIEFIETESIKDGILKSMEKVNFRIRVSDSNLYNGEYFIFGDFSEIDFRDGFEEKAGLCSLYSENTVQCDFNGIEVVNGYLDREVHFTISDSAGNTVISDYRVEIFKVSNEVVSSYKISNINTLNPINHDVMKSRGGTAWFEGKLTTKDNQMTVINYQLQSCDESNIDPLIILDFGLYPENGVVVGEGDDLDFALFFELRNHPNLGDLNDINMKCTMSVLKRDDTQVYAPELVEFNVVFSFFDVPGGDLLERQASNILSMTNEVAWAEGWFDTLFSIYHLLSELCNVVTTGGGVLTTATDIYKSYKVLTDSEAFVECTSLSIEASVSVTYPVLAVPGVSCQIGTPVISKINPASGVLIPCPTPQPVGFAQCWETHLGNKASVNTQGALEVSKDGLLDSLSDITGPIKAACDWVTCRNGAHILGMVTDSVGTSNSDILGDIPVLGDLIDVQNELAGAVCGDTDPLMKRFGP